MNQEHKYFHMCNTSKEEEFFDAYYAVDKDGWSLRFLEKKADGSIYYADKSVEVGKTFLPEASVYPLNQIANGYKVEEINKEVFDVQWNDAVIFAKKHNLESIPTGTPRKMA
jgi:hypothetical protein